MYLSTGGLELQSTDNGRLLTLVFMAWNRNPELGLKHLEPKCKDRALSLGYIFDFFLYLS